VEIFEEDIEAGGLPARAMTDERLNRQLLLREIEGATASGIEFRGNTSFGEDINLEYLWREGFAAAFIAAGQQSTRLPEIPGADLPGVIDALSFLSAARRGVKRELTASVAVIGNDNMAVDTALLAGELGAERVYLVTGHSAGALAAAPERLAEARARGIDVLTGRKVRQIGGVGRVEALSVPAGRARKAGADQQEGERIPEELEVGTVIMAGGRQAAAALAEHLAGQLRMNPEGTIQVDPDTFATSRAGVFAGGEIVTGSGLVVSACDQGRRAAISIHRYLGSRSANRTPPGERHEDRGLFAPTAQDETGQEEPGDAS
jgi:NADPH-dependent glutamate synthase beta subunit-like oxidoreductase